MRRLPLPWGSTHLHRSGGAIEEVLDQSLGIYSTQPTAHLELAARVAGFGFEDLRRVVEVDRYAARLRTLRGSAFIIPVHLLPVIQAATREKNLRSTLGFVRPNLHSGGYETWAERIEDLLVEGPLSSRDIRDRLDPPEIVAGAIRYVIAAMATENRITTVAGSGSWRSHRPLFGRWRDWFPDVDVWSIDADTGRSELARLYLDRHGPATVADLAWWAGLTRKQATRAVEQVAEPIAGTEYWASRPPEPQRPPPLRLLPIWDTLFVTYRDRGRFLSDEQYPYVYDRDGNATSVVLDGGRAVGVWDLGRDDVNLEIRVAPFAGFTAGQWRAIRDESDRLGALIGSSSVTVTRMERPVDLTTAKRNRFMSPLKGED